MSSDRLDCGCYAIRLCRLHQAAPELLEACRSTLSWLTASNDDPVVRFCKIDMAIKILTLAIANATTQEGT